MKSSKKNLLLKVPMLVLIGCVFIVGFAYSKPKEKSLNSENLNLSEKTKGDYNRYKPIRNDELEITPIEPHTSKQEEEISSNKSAPREVSKTEPKKVEKKQQVNPKPKSHTPKPQVQKPKENPPKKKVTEGLMQLEIPKIGLYEAVRRGSGDYQDVLSYSVATMSWSPTPDKENSNVSAFAHNIKHFKNLNALKQGDSVIIHYDNKQYIYKVEKTFEVHESESYILKDIGYSAITMFTCIKGKPEDRFVVRGRLIDVKID